MNQEVLLQSLGAHLDYLQSIFSWVIILSVVTAWAGIQRKGEIEALGIKIGREHAFYGVCALYLIVNVAVLMIFLRVSDLLQMMDAGSFTKGLSALATHSWILNPFSYFGGTKLARLYSCGGLGLLIVVWWLANASLSTLKDGGYSRTDVILSAVFLLTGLGSLAAIFYNYYIITTRLGAMNTSLGAAFSDAFFWESLASVLGVVVGVMAFFAAQTLKRRLRQ